jgi:phenylalanyl-tRNA synthetase beta chain
LFETGLVFLPELGKKYGQDIVAAGQRPDEKTLAALYDGVPPQPRYISGLLTGDAITKQPGQKAEAYNWEDALTAVQQISLGAGVSIGVQQGTHKAFHPGRTAELLLEGNVIGYAGELLPALAEAAHLPRTVAVYELNLDALCEAAGIPHTAHLIGTMPAATQDVSLVVHDTITVAQLHDALVEGAGQLLEEATLVDVYQGTGIPEEHKSVTFALRFRAPDRTLTQAEATEAKEAGVAVAATMYKATIRE